MDRIEDANLYTAADAKAIKAIIEATLAGPIPFRQLNGCGRVYMSFGWKTLKKSSALAKTLNGVGRIRVTARPYYKGANFYMGYDNADGRASSEAEAIAAALKAAGYYASVDYDAD